MSLIRYKFIAGVLALSTSWALAAPQTTIAIKPKEESEAAAGKAAELRQASTVLLLTEKGKQLGSGVLVSRGVTGAWVATNRHVVASQSRVCVMTADRLAFAAQVLPEIKEKLQGTVDLALIWLPGDEKVAFPAAAIKDESLIAQDLPLVVATGFPTPSTRSDIGPSYRESMGLLVPLLSSPLQDGLDLAYTAYVDKGMSGGGVFHGNDLIGINSAHRDPLWPGQWRDGRGRAVEQTLNEKLDTVSLGISAKQIKEALMAAKQPSASDLNRLMQPVCNPGEQDGRSVSLRVLS